MDRRAFENATAPWRHLHASPRSPADELHASVIAWANSEGRWPASEEATRAAWGSGALWVVTNRIRPHADSGSWSWGRDRLWRFAEGAWTVVELPTRWNGPAILQMLASRHRGCLIVATVDGVHQVEGSGAVHRIARGWIDHVCESFDGTLYGTSTHTSVIAIQSDGSERWVIDAEELAERHPGFPDPHDDPIVGLTIDAHGDLWILGEGAERYLVRYRPEDRSSEMYLEGDLGLTPISLGLDNEGNLLVGGPTEHITAVDNQRRESETIRRLQAVVDSGDEDAPEAMLSLGRLHEHSGRTDSAVVVYRGLIESSYESAPRGSLALARLLQNAGQEGAAIALFEGLVESGHAAYAPEAMFHLGTLHERARRAGLAVDAYQAAIDTGHPEISKKAYFRLRFLQGPRL